MTTKYTDAPHTRVMTQVSRLLPRLASLVQ